MGGRSRWEYFRAVFRRYREGVEIGEGPDSGRVLSDLWVQPQVRDWQALGSAAWAEAASAAAREAPASLRLAGDFDFTRSLGGGRVSLVGEAEGDGAGVDAADPGAFSPEP